MYTTATILSKCPAFKHLVKVKLAMDRDKNHVLINTEMEMIFQQFQLSLPPAMEQFFNRCSGKEGPHWACCVVAIRWISEKKVALDIVWPNPKGKPITKEIIGTVKFLT